ACGSALMVFLLGEALGPGSAAAFSVLKNRARSFLWERRTPATISMVTGVLCVSASEDPIFELIIEVGHLGMPRRVLRQTIQCCMGIDLSGPIVLIEVINGCVDPFPG